MRTGAPAETQRSGFGGEKEAQWNERAFPPAGKRGICNLHTGVPKKLRSGFLGKGRAVERARPRACARARDVKLARTCLPNVYQKMPAIPWGARGSVFPDSTSLPCVYQSNFLTSKRPGFSETGPLFVTFSGRLGALYSSGTQQITIFATIWDFCRQKSEIK